jgi:4-amino-4-deoxy-L-arabinose transferase-like glycosyltransferase
MNHEVVAVSESQSAQSTPTYRTVTIALVIAAAAAVLYGHRLDFAPPHVEIDEVLIALDAHAIATTGRDLGGERLPLYSQTASHSWYQPLVIYVTALVLEVLPFTEWAIRAATVAVGVLNIVLTYFVARALFDSDGLGLVAAAMLALSPAHFIHSRYAMDYIYPLPFILGWLLCLIRYDITRRPGLLVAGGCLLGVGFYSYIASMVMMPMYVGLTCLMLFQHASPLRAYRIAVASFVPWLMPFVVWLARHPAAYAATIEKYGLYDTAHLDAVQGLRSAFSYGSIAERLSQYWNFFNPSFLFFGSGTKLMFSTNRAGVLLLAVAGFLAVGLYRAVAEWRTQPIVLVVLLGFLTAPMAALIVAEENAIFRALALIPFGILLATLGVRHLWSGLTQPVRMPYRVFAIVAGGIGTAYAIWTLVTRGRITASPLLLVSASIACVALARLSSATNQWRGVTMCLLAAMAFQFAGFWSDYFTDYRGRVAYWLGGNLGGALESMIELDGRAPVPALYFSTLAATSGQIDGRDQYVADYWKFYLIKHRREDLLERTRPFDGGHVEAVPRGSLILSNDGNAAIDTLVDHGVLHRVATIPELNGTPFFTILQR